MIKPLLALKCPKGMSFEDFLSKIQYPVYATPKIDGIRCRTEGDTVTAPGFLCVAQTRSLKAIPNHHIRHQIESKCPPWLDGELTCGNNFQAVTSGIMTHGGMPGFIYYVFDYAFNIPVVPYVNRIAEMNALVDKLPHFVKLLIPRKCDDLEALLEYETECLKNGAEGVMIRPGDSGYNTGYSDNRAKFKRPWLVAIKRFDDGEAEIVGFNEAMQNTNPGQLCELGFSVRPSNKAGMVGKQTLGSLIVRDLQTKVEFCCGTGFSATDRDDIWKNMEYYLGKIIKYKWQVHGTKDKPRIPVWLGMRDAKDMS